MDIPRQTSTRLRSVRRVAFIVAGVCLSALTAFGVSRLQPAIPTIEGERIVLGRVIRGTMIRNVRGSGRLVSEQVEQITSEISGRIKAIHVKPGTPVTADTILLELDNPAVEKNLMDAKLTFQATESALTDFLVDLERTNLDLKAARFQAAASFNEAKLQAEIDDELWNNGLISRRQHELSLARSRQAMELRDIQLERVRLSQQTTEEKLAVQKQRIEVARHAVKLAEDDLNSLQVRARVAGVLQQLGSSGRIPFEHGQQVPLGTLLAVVTTSARLKTELEVPQAQAPEILVGQSVTVEAVSSRDLISGRVVRIDPSVQSGTVLVEVSLTSELPKGARPDLSVYGTIEIERLENVLHVDRPPYAQSGTTANLFRLAAGGKKAKRTTVRFGQSDISTIEVVQGLAQGDQVILSDMRNWEGTDEIQIQ